MEYRYLVGRLLVISIFVFVGYGLITTPSKYEGKLGKAAEKLSPLLKSEFGLEIPTEDIKLNAPIILQTTGALALVGALGVSQKSSLGVLVLVALTLVASLAELPVLYSNLEQKRIHTLNLLKTLGVLGSLLILYTSKPHPKEEIQEDLADSRAKVD